MVNEKWRARLWVSKIGRACSQREVMSEKCKEVFREKVREWGVKRVREWSSWVEFVSGVCKWNSQEISFLKFVTVFLEEARKKSLSWSSWLYFLRKLARHLSREVRDFSSWRSSQDISLVKFFRSLARIFSRVHKERSVGSWKVRGDFPQVRRSH